MRTHLTQAFFVETALSPLFKQRVNQIRQIDAENKSPRNPLRSSEFTLARKPGGFLAANGALNRMDALIFINAAIRRPHVVGVPSLRSWETAVTSCAGANGLVRRTLLGTPCEGQRSA